MRRLKQIEEENGKLKKLVVDLSLEGDGAGRDPPKAMRLAGSASSSTKSATNGRSRSAEPARRWSLTGRPTITRSRRSGQAALERKIKDLSCPR